MHVRVAAIGVNATVLNKTSTNRPTRQESARVRRSEGLDHNARYADKILLLV